MESVHVRKDTNAWILQVWLSFFLAAGTTAFGILFLPVDIWLKGFLGMGLLFTMGSCFQLAKTIRDNHEATRLINRVSEARTEKILREFEFKDAA